jgi:hypothetical protein
MQFHHPAATLVLDAEMKGRHAAAMALVLLALALGASACGGSSSKTTKTSAAQQRAAEQHWRKGIIRWHRSTQSALDGISIIFATQASLDSIRNASSALSSHLLGYEVILIQCSRTIRALGPVPVAFAMAGRYAVRACKTLEKGEHAVEHVVGGLRHGGGYETLDPLSGAGDLLSTGQAELTTTMSALHAAITT